MAHPRLILRPVLPTDMDAYFAMMGDPEAIQMAAFTPPNPDDRAAFDARWRRILSNPTGIVRTIVLVDEVGERVAGTVSTYIDEGRTEVSYWTDRALWGQGIATEALRLFLDEITDRPLFARAAADNAASLRVLESNGFARVAVEQGFAPARGATIDEVVLVLGMPPAA